MIDDANAGGLELLQLGIGAPGIESTQLGLDLDAFIEARPDLELLTCIGRGGMGLVYRARQTGLERLVAVKLLDPALLETPGLVERFMTEARAMGRLSHPSIVQIHDVAEASGIHFIVMQLVNGPDLRAVLRSRQRLGWREACDILLQLCDALEHAHERGVIHRDVKPENILLEPGGKVWVTDFGLAKLERRGDLLDDERESVMGTPTHMAPEQRAGERVDRRADIFASGVLLYEVLTGHLPVGGFRRPSELTETTDLPQELDRIVARALEANPEDRFQSAREMGEAIRRTVASDTEQEHLAPTNDRTRSTTVLIASVLAVIAASVIAFLLAKRADETRSGGRDVVADQWFESSLHHLSASTQSVIGLDWSNIAESPFMHHAGTVLQGTQIPPACRSLMSPSRTEYLLIGLDSDNRPLEIVLKADWLEDEYQGCVKDFRTSVYSMQRFSSDDVKAGVQQDDIVLTTKLHPPPLLLPRADGDQAVPFASDRGTIILGLQDQSPEQLERQLRRQMDDPSTPINARELIREGNPIWWKLTGAGLPYEAEAWSGTARVWDALDLETSLTFPGSAKAADAQRKLDATLNAASAVASIPKIEDLRVARDQRVVSAQATLSFTEEYEDSLIIRRYNSTTNE